ncbi:F-actin-capping protein subunit alpha, partial [Coemansia nantahalensis]
MSSGSKLAKAAGLLLHSPPGEVDDVFNDIRGIVGDDEALQSHIEPVLAESNMQQFLVAEVPGGGGSKVLLTPYNRAEGGRFVDPNTRTTFAFDNLHRTASDPQAAEGGAGEEEEGLRAAVQRELDAYVAAHYPAGAASAFAHAGAVVACVVSNRFSPGNFWNGSWRAVWSYDPATRQLNGSAKIRVHYFEDGNVQLDTQSDFTADVPAAAAGDDGAAAKKVVAVIRQYEADFQQSISDGYRQLADKTFKGLRRTLPV